MPLIGWLVLIVITLAGAAYVFGGDNSPEE